MLNSKLSNVKKVLLLANTSWYLVNFRASTIRAFIQAGYSVICISPFDEHSYKIAKLGAQFLRLDMDGANTRPLNELFLLKELLGTIKHIQPDIIFNFTIKMNIYAGLCSYVLRIPYINNVTGLGTAFIHKSPTFIIARLLYGFANKRAARVFFQNEDDQSHFIQHKLVDTSKAILLPGSGINIKKFSKQPLPDTPITFLMIARLIADKGVREFVNAARVVKRTFPDARFILLGPNSVQNHSAIADEELSNWVQEGVVELFGPTYDVRPWLKDCHVLVLPSYREGMPRTVLEAAAVGRPAIVTDVPGCRHSIVPGETGWLCEVRNSDSLAKQMIYVINNKRLIPQFGQKASERVRREFSDKIVINEYLKCMDFLKLR